MVGAVSVTPHTPLGTLPKMPAPSDIDPADGYNSFYGSVYQANANYALGTAWSQTAADTYVNMTYYTQTSVTMQPNWSLVGFTIAKCYHLYILAGIFTYTGAASISSDAACQFAAGLNICQLPAAVLPTGTAVCVNARLVNTAVHLAVNSPATMLSLVSCAIPSRTFATGSQLVVNASYVDRGYDTLVLP